MKTAKKKILKNTVNLASPVRPNLVTKYKNDFYRNWHKKQLNAANFNGAIGIETFDFLSASFNRYTLGSICFQNLNVLQF